MILSHALGPGGEPDPMWSTGPPFWAEVPAGGARLVVVRDRNVRTIVRSHVTRNLAEVEPWHAVAGVTLGHRHAMLALAGDEARQVRRLIEPAFAPKVAVQYERRVWEFAEQRARQARSGDDLVTAFCEPFVLDCMRLLAGVDPHALRALSDRTTGTLVREIPDHATITGTWGRLYEFTQPAVEEARHGWGESMMPRCIQTMDSELGFPMTWRTATTIYNGFPTVLSAVIKMLEYLLMRSWLMQACCEHPELIPGVVRGALKDAVHFTFGLPGVCMIDSIVDGLVIRAGTVVLPSFHGAESSAGLRAWGSPGVHQCLGMHIVRIILESAVRAITRRLRGPAVPGLRSPTARAPCPCPRACPSSTDPGHHTKGLPLNPVLAVPRYMTILRLGCVATLWQGSMSIPSTDCEW